ncbi:hypothetical protein D3C81_1375760 [compost metagenome]
MLFLPVQPLVQKRLDGLHVAHLVGELDGIGRLREGGRVVKAVGGDGMQDRRPVVLGPFQISGGGLERDPFPAPGAAIHEGDFDAAFRCSFNTSPVSTHDSYPFTSIKIRLSGALIQTASFGQIPSRIFVLIASGVYPDSLENFGMVM